MRLNHKIVVRLRFLNHMRSHRAMLDFRIGERVKFSPGGRPDVVGTLARYNKKTVTVIADSGEHWNVAPNLLCKVESAARGSSQRGEVTVMQLANGADRK